MGSTPDPPVWLRRVPRLVLLLSMSVWRDMDGKLHTRSTFSIVRIKAVGKRQPIILGWDGSVTVAVA
jgi:hypothetical protein